jgi:transcription antitermination factor NusG
MGVSAWTNGNSLARCEHLRVFDALLQRKRPVRLHLRAQHFCASLPLHHKTVWHVRNLTNVSVLFIPNYPFVFLDLKRDGWGGVNGTLGVANLVMAEDCLLPVPVAVVEALVSGCGADDHLRPGNALTLDELVRVLIGPFAAVIGKSTRIDGTRRAQVLLGEFGGDALAPMLAA